jgi:hypothetical protein
MKIITQERFEELLSGRMDDFTPGEVKSVITAATESGLKCEVKEYNSLLMRKTEVPTMRTWFTGYRKGMWPDNLYLEFRNMCLDIYKTEDDYFPISLYSQEEDLESYKLCDGLSEVCALVRSITDH